MLILHLDIEDSFNFRKLQKVLFSLILQRFMDKTSYVRKEAVIYVFNILDFYWNNYAIEISYSEDNNIMICWDWIHFELDMVLNRIQDVAVTVRKPAIQLLWLIVKSLSKNF